MEQNRLVPQPSPLAPWGCLPCNAVRMLAAEGREWALQLLEGVAIGVAFRGPAGAFEKTFVEGAAVCRCCLSVMDKHTGRERSSPRPRSSEHLFPHPHPQQPLFPELLFLAVPASLLENG